MALNNYPHAKEVARDDKTETVYYTEQGRVDKENSRLYNNIDWLALAKDKIALIYLQDSQLGSTDFGQRMKCSNILALIDAVQDDAQERGYPVVWHMCTESWAEILRDQNKTRAVFETAATELFETLKTVVDSSGRGGGLEQREYRVVSDKAIAAARELLKRLEADDGTSGQ